MAQKSHGAAISEQHLKIPTANWANLNEAFGNVWAFSASTIGMLHFEVLSAPIRF